MSAADRIKELTRPTGQEDILAVDYPAPRLKVGVKQSVTVAVVVFVLVGAWALTRQPAATSSPEWETAAANEPVPEQIVVAVVGEVAHPGLVTLDQGARIADALDVAQPHPHADLITLNLAQLLVDGQQIHVQPIGAPPPPGITPAGVHPGGGQPAGAQPGGGISLNTASAAELTTLPGVGDATAAAIIAHREKNGPFTSIEGLLDVKGIGPAKFDALKDLVAL